MTKIPTSVETDSSTNDILTVREVAEYLRLAESTVYRLAQEGEIPGRKIGGTWRFSRQGIKNWINYRSLRKVHDKVSSQHGT